MIVEKIALELLALIILIALVVLFARATHKAIQAGRAAKSAVGHMLPVTDAERRKQEEAHFTELLSAHERLERLRHDAEQH